MGLRINTRDIPLVPTANKKYQRKGIDHDPVEPWNWASFGITADPVEIVSYPIPAEGETAIDHHTATVMVRRTVGDPCSMVEVPLAKIAAFCPSRHEWSLRPKRYTGDGLRDFVFLDG